jgi:hypothetical protein
MNSYFEKKKDYSFNLETNPRLRYRLQVLLHFERKLYGFPIFNSHCKKVVGSKWLRPYVPFVYVNLISISFDVLNLVHLVVATIFWKCKLRSKLTRYYKDTIFGI